MELIEFNIIEESALKNCFVGDNTKGSIIECFIRHRDSFSIDFINYITTYEILDYVMKYNLQPKEYLWFVVLTQSFTITIFIAEVNNMNSDQLQSFFNSEVLLKFNSDTGLKVW